MKYLHLLLTLLMFALLSACASQQNKTHADSVSRPNVKAVAAKKRMPANSVVKTDKSIIDGQAVDGQVIGVPLSGGKFFRLKIGMALAEVEKLIGSTNRHWKHHGEKVSSYSHEGVLTFSYGKQYLLTRILVNRIE